ncbi:hypothetical protein [Streptomyces acidiscabies]|uniref:Uncharacterized protein n=1 Tax=Streptomyces acidiscabies TaxID=42234 RepID=A0ABU4LWA3_9ACTN|nr:hypothetical protein [Streptomyces acidiscabies]MDX3020000.1 hypothetical protein [Streptomyces acidiscabies]
MFSIGDMVRFEIETADGFTERHYAPIEQFRKRDKNFYRRTPANPYAVFLAPEHTHTQVLPLTRLTPAIDDFEMVDDRAVINKDAGPWIDNTYKCLRCSAFTYRAADVMAVHKQSGLRVRLCEDCWKPQELAVLGHQALWHQRNCKATILDLRAAPDLITGPAADSAHGKSDADTYREWADAFPWLVPDPAARLYAAWKENQSAPLGA